MGLNSTAVAIQPNVSCTCNCKRSLFQSMEISKYRPAALRGWACSAGRADGSGRWERGRGSSPGCGRSALPTRGGGTAGPRLKVRSAPPPPRGARRPDPLSRGSPDPAGPSLCLGVRRRG